MAAKAALFKVYFPCSVKTRLIKAFCRIRLHIFIFRRGNFSQLQKRLSHSRIMLLQHREQLQPDCIPLVLRQEVGRILRISQALLPAKADKSRFVNTQEGADEFHLFSVRFQRMPARPEGPLPRSSRISTVSA